MDPEVEKAIARSILEKHVAAEKLLQTLSQGLEWMAENSPEGGESQTIYKVARQYAQSAAIALSALDLTTTIKRA